MRNVKLFFVFAIFVIFIFLYLSISDIVLVNTRRKQAQRQRIVSEMFDNLVSKHERLKEFLKSREIQFEKSVNRKSIDVSTPRRGFLDSVEDDDTLNDTDNDSAPIHDRIPNMKYILQWTPNDTVPFVYMEQGQNTFIKRKCKYTNCFVTFDRNWLGDYTLFDVVAFAGPQLVGDYMEPESLPEIREPHQKYVFASIESADYYPVCTDTFNNYFNWTWTYRLDSDMRWGYIVITDSTGRIIGPKKNMHWLKLESMKPVSSKLKNILSKKKKAAAWFVSNCRSSSKREKFVRKLTKQLKKYKLGIDIYGQCGHKECSREDEEKCGKLIETDYFFYLSFENAFSEDYVTEKLLHGLKYSAIPIVYGGANYTRFMPDGIYLNARKLGVTKLAAKMHELIGDKEKYSEYFKWRNHYSYHRTSAFEETDEYCAMCALLNNEKKAVETTVYENFRKWWDPPESCLDDK